MTAITHTTKDHTDKDVLEMCLYTLTYLSLTAGFEANIVRNGVVDSLTKISKELGNGRDVLRVLSVVLRSLSTPVEARELMVGEEQYINLLTRCFNQATELEEKDIIANCLVTSYNFSLSETLQASMVKYPRLVELMVKSTTIEVFANSESQTTFLR